MVSCCMWIYNRMSGCEHQPLHWFWAVRTWKIGANRWQSEVRQLSTVWLLSRIQPFRHEITVGDEMSHFQAIFESKVGRKWSSECIIKSLFMLYLVSYFGCWQKIVSKFWNSSFLPSFCLPLLSQAAKHHRSIVCFHKCAVILNKGTLLLQTPLTEWQ